MGQPAAKLGDTVTATDTHIVLVPSPTGPVPTLAAVEFRGTIGTGCSQNVLIDGKPAAVTGSLAMNEPPHVPPEGSFAVPPTNQATIITGSATVLINGRPAARNGDTATTCNDPAPLPVGKVVSASTVLLA